MNIFDIQGLLNNTATVLTKIEILPKTVGESIITLTNENSVKKWVYSDLRYVDKQGFIGQFVARTLDGELQDISDDFDIEDREIVLYLGINSNHIAEITTETGVNICTQASDDLITELGEYETTYYKLGNFFIEKPSSDNVKDITKFQSQDYTMLFNVPFNGDYTDTTYTKSFNGKLADNEVITALWLAQYTCAQVGVTLATTTFRNSSFIIDSNQFDSDYTCRDVIKSIAKLAFTWARIGWDNRLYLDFDKQTTTLDYNEINNDLYYKLTTQTEVYGEVNRILTGSSIVVGNSAYIEDSQSISDNGLTELDVYDNPILYTQTLRQNAVANASPLLGLIYQPVELETTGHPWLLGNELIKIVDMEGNSLYTYPFDRVLTYNGHIRSKISSMAKTEIQSTYKYNGVENNNNEIKRSKVELDRQNQTLTSTIGRVSDNETNITRLQQDVDSINLTVGGVSGTGGLIGALGDLSDEFNDFYNEEYLQQIEDLQNQIDGTIDFWTGNDVPTLNNEPAVEWTTEEDKQAHNGDVYTIVSGQSSGASYRFVKDNNVWKWIEISDAEVGAIRQLAQSAYDLADDVQGDFDDFLQDDYDVLKTAQKTTSIANTLTINDCGEYILKDIVIYGTTNGVSGKHTISVRKQGQTVEQGQTFDYDLDDITLNASGDNVDSIYHDVETDKWYLSKQTTTPATVTELNHENLENELTAILDEAQLYSSDIMIISDIATSGDNANLKVTYLTDTVFNAIYASRSDLNITKHGITGTVKETVYAEVFEPLDGRIDKLGDTVNKNTDDLDKKITNVDGKFKDYAKQSELETVSKTATDALTATGKLTQFQETITKNGTDKVTTSTGFLFNKDGLSIMKTGAKTKTFIDQDGMTVYDTTGSDESELLNVDSQGVQTENIHVRTFTQIGDHTRLQDYEDGTAIFYIE